MEPTLMTDAHGNSFWVTKTFMQPEINLDPASDPLALDVKPKPEPSSVKLEPGTEPALLDTFINVSLFESTVEQESDPLALDVKPKPELLEVKQESGLPLDPDTDPLDNITDNNTPRNPRSPPRFVPFNSSTRQARSIEPSAMHIKTEPPSDMQDSLRQGILPDSRSAEDQSSSVFNEAPQPAVARSDSTDNQVFDSVCRSDCVDSESRDDDSIQLTSDTSLAVKYNLKQCSVSLRRVSSTHTAPGIVSDRSPFQSSDKETPSTSRSRKRPLKLPCKSTSTLNNFLCKVCFLVLRSYATLHHHKRKYPNPHIACMKCRIVFDSKSELEVHHRFIHLKDFSCNVCGKVFSSESYLKVHGQVHLENPQTCSVCHKTYNSKSSLRTHLKKHDIIKIVIPCNVCGKMISKNTFAMHMKSHNKEFKCDMCGKEFASKTKLGVHILKHLNIRDHTCGLCTKSFTRKCDLLKHQEVHIKTRDHKCHLCRNSFKSERYLRDHIRNHTKKFMCNICKKSYGKKHELTNHMLRHLNKFDFKCEICGKCFVSQSLLNAHKKCHVSQRYPCNECDNTYSNKYVLSQHVLRCHHRPSGGPGFPCSCCSNVFVTEQELTSHLKSHGLFCVSCDVTCVDVASFKVHLADFHGDMTKLSCRTCRFRCESQESLTKHEKLHLRKPYRCSKCSLKFPKKENLKLHIKRTHAIGNYSCDLCPKMFASEKNLKVHSNIHIKPKQCNICDQKFFGMYELNKHISLHHSTQPVTKYSCKVCSRSFNLLGTLYVHHRSHTKPFTCDKLDCDKAFSSKVNLTLHQEVHITEKTHNCDICKKPFGLISNLVRHKKGHAQKSRINTK